MIRFLWTDAAVVAISEGKGMTFDGTEWRPSGGAVIVARSALEDERALDMSEAEVSAFIAKAGGAMPNFSA